MTSTPAGGLPEAPNPRKDGPGMDETELSALQDELGEGVTMDETGAINLSGGITAAEVKKYLPEEPDVSEDQTTSEFGIDFDTLNENLERIVNECLQAEQEKAELEVRQKMSFATRELVFDDPADQARYTEITTKILETRSSIRAYRSRLSIKPGNEAILERLFGPRS